MDYAKESLKLHEQWKGKIEVVATVPVSTKDDLSLAYTPGVAQPCLEIQKDINKSYELTRRHNLCAVITDGTAVLGLALANQILSACGKPLLPIDSAQLEQWVTAGLTSAAAIWAWWENNSFTKEALAADSYLEQLKKGVH